MSVKKGKMKKKIEKGEKSILERNWKHIDSEKKIVWMKKINLVQDQLKCVGGFFLWREQKNTWHK